MREPGPQESTRQGEAPQGRRLLAVLPFENISGNGEGYFAAGMTQEVTSQLSKLSALRVIGRTAVAQFKEPRSQLSVLAKELGIGSAVTGTVREDGARVRVNVDLIDAQTGQLIWSEQYDREGVDVFAAQSDIALRVGQAPAPDAADRSRPAVQVALGDTRRVLLRAHALDFQRSRYEND